MFDLEASQKASRKLIEKHCRYVKAITNSKNNASMEELIEMIDEEITSSCNVSHKESRSDSDGHLSTYYIIHGSALSCLIVDQHPIESRITATVFVKNDQQRVKNALIAGRDTPEDTLSHILYQFRIKQNEDNTFRVFKSDDTEYKGNSVEEVVNTVVRRLIMEIEKHIQETNESQDINK